ncbi:MAG TPA: single-stranded DNA-binding protein [Deltaproteobacteria bacterium]|nr:single-stranded DNA-binding protein [Deltaproteobacteria bacterium]
MSLGQISRTLCDAVDSLHFSAPVTHVYNPLVYARACHDAYLERFGQGTKQVVMLGMNPGPWGMAQTGVPFGEVAAVRDWMGISEVVAPPRQEHPKRKVQGLDCPRSEVSGRRLWGWARDRFGSPEIFFERFFVVNYCPLSFMEEGGKNRTPDKLPAVEQRPLFSACDAALVATIDLLDPEWVIGVGAFAEAKARKVLGDRGVQIGRVLHPSPASPLANRGWAERAEQELQALGVL